MKLRFLALLLPLAALAQAPKPVSIPALPEAPKPAPETINPALPTIWIASDSTAANRGPELVGWGVPIADYFDLTKVNVVNRAVAGRSSRTFITEGRWDKLMAGVKKGDWVFIQFGHNDASPVNEDASVPPDKRRSRGSLPGLGEETQDIVNILNNKPETIHTFGWYVRKMIADVKAKEAVPIIFSLTVRNYWKDGKVERGSGNYRVWDRELAQAAGVQFIDLTRIIADKYQELGEAKAKDLFGTDRTHTNLAGGILNAECAIAGLKGIRQSPFTELLSAKGKAIEADKLGWLNLPEPADPKLPSIVLIGDSLTRNGRNDGAGNQWGWGEPIARFFDPAKINVVNRAHGGTSSRTYRTEGDWNLALTLIKPGDFVLIQFGHNDPGPLNEDASVPRAQVRARGTIKGTGEETAEVDNILTKQHEVVHTFGWYIRQYVREARAAGATPIVLSLTPRMIWKEGKIVRSGADGYGGWARQVAEQEGVAFIDANDLIATRYEALGPDKVKPLFGDPNLHTTKAGADLNAEVVAGALRALPASPFLPYFRATL